MLPRTPGRRIPFLLRGSSHDRPVRATEIRHDGHARPFAGRGAAVDRHRAHRISNRGRSVRDASDPAFACTALSGDAGRNGICGQRHHHGHGARRARRRLLQPAYRPPARHSRQPCRAGDPDQPACVRAEPHRFHDIARRAGPVHGVCLCADARLSRRAMQRDGCRRCVRGLHHRQCRQQSDRPLDLGCRRRQLWPGVELLPFRAAQHRRRDPRLFHHQACPADACDGRAVLTASGHACALAQPAASRRVRHRLLHPVRVHRHFHLRQLRAGAHSRCRSG